jgi:hypothetical protein
MRSAEKAVRGLTVSRRPEPFLRDEGKAFRAEPRFAMALQNLLAVVRGAALGFGHVVYCSSRAVLATIMRPPGRSAPPGRLQRVTADVEKRCP